MSRRQENPPRKRKACAQKVTVATEKEQVEQRRLVKRPGFIVGLGTRSRAEAGQ